MIIQFALTAIADATAKLRRFDRGVKKPRNCPVFGGQAAFANSGPTVGKGSIGDLTPNPIVYTLTSTRTRVCAMELVTLDDYGREQQSVRQEPSECLV